MTKIGAPVKQDDNLLFYYVWLIVFFSYFIIMGLFFEPIDQIIEGLINITFDSSVLITDYFAVGGIGATLMNAGLLPILSLILMYRMKLKPNGSLIMSLLLVFGFGFFGKNWLNVWPLVIGVYLHAKAQGAPFRNYITIAMLSTCLSPTVNQIFLLVPNGGFHINIILSLLGGIFIGFILPPVISHCTKIHEGFILSNTGFAAGFVSLVLVAVFRSFGLPMASKSVWSTEYTAELLFILVSIFAITLFFGLVLNADHSGEFWELSKESGRVVTDYFLLYGNAAPLINIGLMGMIYTAITYSITGVINGPFMAGILLVAGFSAFGANMRNTLPVTLGGILAAHLNAANADPKLLMMIMLFGTAIAPFSGYFGPHWGILAGFIHVSLSLVIGGLSAGINLYNTGFIAGLVILVLLPIASTFHDD